MALLVAQAARPQADLSASFAVPDGCTVSLWAESPLFYNPTAMDIDPQGRVWITEAVNYRQWDGRNPGRHHDAGDRVVVVEDRDGDGTAETSTVFLQDPELVSPLGICWLPDKVLVSCSPTVWACYDDDGDLRADRKEVFLTGFGGFNHDHGAHSFSVAPDGRLYMALGNAGPHVVTDKSGWTLRSGSIYDDGGPAPTGNRPGLLCDDGRAYTGGLILRCNQDGTGLAVMAHNFRNPYEVAVDAFGDMWTFDNDDDGNEACRVTWVMEGGNYGYMSADGSRFWQADRRPGQSVQRAHWHQDDPGVMPTTLITGSGGPTGVCVYEGEGLGEEFDGALLCADAGRNCVYALDPEAAGASFSLRPIETKAAAPSVPGAPEGSEPLTGLLVSRPAHEGDETWGLFRPSDVCVAPDGSVLVSDWFDPGVGGHRAQDHHAYGRMLRVTTPAGPLALASQRGVTRLEALERLASPAQSVRADAFASLMKEVALPDELIAAVRTDESRSQSLRARIAHFEARHNGSGEPKVFWTSGVWAAVETLSGRGTMDIESLFDLPDRVWLEINAGIGPIYGFDGRPRRSVPSSTMARRLPAVRAAAWHEWTSSEALYAWRMHPDALVPDFLARAQAPALDRDARVQSLEALGFCSSREAAEAMLTLALAGPPDTRELAAWWVEHNARDVWRDYALGAHLAAHAWTDADIVWRSGPVTHGSVPIDVDVSGSRRIALVVTDAGNGNGCDWADWLDPRIADAAAPLPPDLSGPPRSLLVARSGSEVPWVSAKAGWGEVRFGSNCDGGPLSIDGVVHEQGIGTHAPSEIVFDISSFPGLQRLVATAAVDDGGTSQPGAPTSVEFLVYADRAAKKEVLAAVARAHRERLLEDLRNPQRSLDQRMAAAEELAGDPHGGAIVLEEAAAGRIAALDGDHGIQRELTDALAEALFRNPDLGVRALASEHFTRPNAPTLPPIADLVALEGDRHAGQSLYFGAARCSACHAVRGRGGDVGPDLSGIRTKYGRGALLDSLLNPSAAIGAGFESLTLTLKDGRVLAGLLQADGPTVLLKDSAGARHAIDAADVVERRPSKLSLMPEDISRDLSPQQLADLCAFLEHDPTTPPKLGLPVSLWNGRDLSGWIAVPDASAWSVRDGDGASVLHCEGQPIGYVRTERAFTSFELSVEWRFPDPSHPGNSGVLLRVQAPDQVWPRSLEAQLNSGDAGDIWNIGDFGADVDPARTGGRHTGKLQPSSERPLGEWNAYRITLRDGDLTLEVNGVVQNRARWCEQLPGSIALQSEGAPIEFRRVELREIED